MDELLVFIYWSRRSVTVCSALSIGMDYTIFFIGKNENMRCVMRSCGLISGYRCMTTGNVSSCDLVWVHQRISDYLGGRFFFGRSMIQCYCSRTICLLASTMDRTPIP